MRARLGATLLVDQRSSLDNGELLHAVRQRANVLRAYSGPGDATVAVYLPNGLDLAVVYLACLTAGLRYLPLPAPPARTPLVLLRGLDVRVLVTTRRDDLRLPVPTVHVDAPSGQLGGPSPGPGQPELGWQPEPGWEADPERPAHVLLTSGSESGMPKAVLTGHRGSLLSHAWRARLWPYTPGREVVGCNIFGVWDLVAALLHGVPVVMLDDQTLRDPADLTDAILRYGITRLMLTPTLLDGCLAGDEGIAGLRRLERIVLCGESLPPGVLERAWHALPGVAIGDLYSLSECHDVAARDLRPGEPKAGLIVADFADVHVCRPAERDQLVPLGQAGRVLVSGPALGHGYVDPQATSQRFMTTDFGGRMAPLRVYDTGDRGRLNADGQLEILGRLDAAVKVRGRWSDPDGLAAWLQDHESVRQALALVIADSRGHSRLHCWVVPASQTEGDLSARLRADLAEHFEPAQLPHRIHELDALPLLPSGKVDVRRLRAEADPGTPPVASKRAAETALEDTVLSVFRHILEQPAAGPDEPFDSLGGDSLTAIILCGALQSATRRRVFVRDLHAHPSAGALARHLRRHLQSDDRAVSRGAIGLPRLRIGSPRMRAAGRLDKVTHVFLTGATGRLGRALASRLLDAGLTVSALVRTRAFDTQTRFVERLAPNGRRDGIVAVPGDLAVRRFGLPEPAFEGIAASIDAVVHLGADLDMFASSDALDATNVQGTRHVLELAAMAAAPVAHLSSSSVLPLDSHSRWDETRRGLAFLERIAPRLADSDGYSQTKLAAESLMWQALAQGLNVSVFRVPHLIGDSDGRLVRTLRTLLSLNVLPDGDWTWQFASLEAVADRLVTHVRGGAGAPLTHLASPPVSAADLAAIPSLKSPPRRLPLPALANLVAARDRAGGHRAQPLGADLLALDQLVREYGIRAALCLGEASLASEQPLTDDVLRLLAERLSASAHN